MEVYLIRHTTPEVAKGVCYGQTDIPLNEILFAHEVKTITSKIPTDIQFYYTSPLQRCKLLTQSLCSKYIVDDRLQELNFGDWENKSWNKINEAQLNSWMADFVNVAPPNGENYLSLHQRTEMFIENILLTDHKKIAIVTHAGNIRSFLSWVLDLPLANTFRIDVAYGAVLSLRINSEKNYNRLISIK